MAFADEVVRAWRCAAKAFGDQRATVIPKSGGVQVEDVPVILMLRTDDRQVGLEGTWGPRDTVEYLMADMGREAERGDVFLIDGKRYCVRAISSNDGCCVQAEVGRCD